MQVILTIRVAAILLVRSRVVAEVRLWMSRLFPCRTDGGLLS